MNDLGITELKADSKMSAQEKINKSLETSIKKLTSENIALKRRVLATEKQFDMLDENAVEKIINATLKDAKKMHDVYRIAYTKLCIATELRYFLRNEPERQAVVLAGIVKAYDLNDEFWNDKYDGSLAALEPVFFEIGEASGILNERDIQEH